MAATVLICGGLFIGFVASGSNNVTVYTQRDFFKYHTLTDTDIENAPCITARYYFEAHPGDGYFRSNSIVFKGAAETVSLRAYLEKTGYAKQKRSPGEKEI